MVKESLAEHAPRFDFTQLVRFLLRDQLNGGDQPAASHRLQTLLQKQLRFSATKTLGFPASPVQSLHWTGETTQQAHIQVNFLGLTGPSGVLPLPYSELLLSWQAQRDHIATKFFDLFHHRLLSLFFAAQTKYSIPDMVLRRDKAFFTMLDSLSATHHSNDTNVTQHDLWFFAGTLRQRPLPASSLEQMIAALLHVDVKLKPLQGEWLTIPEIGQGSLARDGLPLDGSIALGARFWDPQARVVLQIKNVSVDKMKQLLPGGSAHCIIETLVRDCLAPDIACDLELHQQGELLPPSRLTSTENHPSDVQLGWSTKLGVGSPRTALYRTRLRR